MIYRKRGRPPTARISYDTGTPELVSKRAAGLTAETLDACRASDIITADQHWCGIHLRWLHTLRFGAPGVRAVDTTSLGGIDLHVDNTDWRAAREEEYQQALALLGQRLSLVALDCCVYNAPLSLHNSHVLVEALDKLVKSWCRKGKIKHPKLFYHRVKRINQV